MGHIYVTDMHNGNLHVSHVGKTRQSITRTNLVCNRGVRGRIHMYIGGTFAV